MSGTNGGTNGGKSSAISGAVLTAIKADIFVALRSRASWLLCLAPALVALLQLLLSSALNAGDQARQALGASSNRMQSAGGGIEGADAWVALIDALGTGLALISLIAVTHAAWSLASDRELGVARHLLIRRVSRPALVLGKLVQTHVLALLSIVLLLLVSLATSALLWDFGPVQEDGYELIGAAEIRAELRLGLWLALIPIPAGIALGVLLSVLCNSSTQALSAALGITLGLDLFKSVLGSAADYLYTSYQVSLLDESYLNDVARLAGGYSDVMLDTAAMQLNQWLPGPQMLLFIVLALFFMHRKKL